MSNLDLDISKCVDIHKKKEYLNLYLKDDEELFEYSYVEGDKKLSSISIKKIIRYVSGVEITGNYYDLETPYGYGGPTRNTEDENFLNRAFEHYREHCRENNIISEFIRFNTFTKPNGIKKYLDFMSNDRKLAVIDLSLTMDEIRSRYSKTTRNIIRKKNVTVSVSKTHDDINGFIELYFNSMSDKGADDFFYFSKDYFNKLLSLDEATLISAFSNGVMISSGVFIFGDVSYYHLSANNLEYRGLNGNYYVLDRAFQVQKEYGSSAMVLGGGLSGCKEDTLLKFKSKFTNIFEDYFIGGMIFNKPVFDELNSIWESCNAGLINKQFQKYRK